jgi:hypothetical protein
MREALRLFSERRLFKLVSILELQIDGCAHERHGKALTNFKATLPPAGVS